MHGYWAPVKYYASAWKQPFNKILNWKFYENRLFFPVEIECYLAVRSDAFCDLILNTQYRPQLLYQVLFRYALLVIYYCYNTASCRRSIALSIMCSAPSLNQKNQSERFSHVIHYMFILSTVRSDALLSNSRKKSAHSTASQEVKHYRPLTSSKRNPGLYSEPQTAWQQVNKV